MNQQYLQAELLEASLLWLKNNSPVVYGSMIAFGMAVLLKLRAGKPLLNAIYTGMICLLISLGFINSLTLFGISQDNALLIGVIIGAMGVERCLAVLQAISNVKTNILMDKNNRKKKNEN